VCWQSMPTATQEWRHAVSPSGVSTSLFLLSTHVLATSNDDASVHLGGLRRGEYEVCAELGSKGGGGQDETLAISAPSFFLRSSAYLFQACE